MKQIQLGNGAIALGAIAAGVKVVTGYPGTPSTEVLQTVAKYNKDKSINVEWSTNEKAALEVAAGASYCGLRTMVTMKQVGLNVASDPLMSLIYIGIKGGMVVLVADDPGPISSQTEQDTRHFAEYANLPVLDPSSPEEAYEMTKYAFDLSERVGLPVIVRPTTKVCHASAPIESDAPRYEYTLEGFVKDPKWCIFPPLAYRRHVEIERQQTEISAEFDKISFNRIEGSGTLGIAAGGVTYAIARDVIDELGLDVTLLKVGAAFPAPEGLETEFIKKANAILVLEELDAVIENQLFHVAGKKHLSLMIQGKHNGFVPSAGELKYDTVRSLIAGFAGVQLPKSEAALPSDLKLPARPPVLCAGCPHRASFYAVKLAAKKSGKKAVYCGDIGCYTLGNAKPLETTDTCLCMGGGITVAQGIAKAEPDTLPFAFVGDSTFFASGMTGIANAVYNNNKITVIILDNSTTAMTGHQPHPGIGKTMMDTQSEKISIEAVVRALNVKFVERCNPLELDKAVDTVKRAYESDGVSVVIFESPCIALVKPDKACEIVDCIGCMRCVKEIGCPAIYIEDGKAKINDTLCTGCGLCKQVCKAKRIH
ncbi:MAG: indolepyruvate ferredoxin oxidoreductase subunit alpha [Clostridia bacterium]|nr:indolepyruvate ferredoxin oxidoreductase subunit alpha [Clostridia bacterium]